MDDITSEMELLFDMSRPTLRPGQHDPVAIFFDNHPSPREIEDATDDISFMILKENTIAAVMCFLSMCDTGDNISEDPEVDFLVDALVNQEVDLEAGVIYAPLQTALGQLALERSRDEKQNTAPAVTKKEKLLEFYNWIIRGRTDETSPFRGPQPEGAASSSAASSAAGGNLHAFLPSSLLTTGPCAKCGTPSAKARCSGCQIVQAGKVVFGVYYCNQDCRAAHWKQHKAACREVRTLRRAATVFTELFHDVLRETWGTVDMTVGQDGITTVQHERGDRLAYLGLPVIRPFPRHLVDSEDQALAFLCIAKCREVLGMGRTLFDQLMRHASRHVEVVHIHPKNVPAPYRTVSPDNQQIFSTLCGHDVTRITLPCGLQFAFDPTGAQFGWREFLSPWHAFQAHRGRVPRVTGVLELHDEAGFREHVRGIRDRRPRCGRAHSQIPVDREEMVAFVTEKIISEAGIIGGGLGTILRQASDHKFEEISKTVVARTKEALRNKLQEIARGPSGKLYWGQDMILCVTQDEHMYRCLKKVWLTEKEYDEMEDEKRVLLWKQRFDMATRGMPSTKN